MSNLINLWGLYLQNFSLEQLPPLQMEEIPEELLKQMNFGDVADLKIMAGKDGALKSFIDIDGKLIEVMLKNHSNTNISSHDVINIRVRLSAPRQLIPLRNIKVSEEVKTPQTQIEVNKEHNVFKNIELSPLKPSKLVSLMLQEKNIMPDTIKEITDKLSLLEVSIAKLGSNTEGDTDLLNSLKNIIQIKDIDVLRNEISKFISNLEGKQIGGQVSSRNQDLTIVKTLFGETLFNSKIKLPLSENLILNIEKIFSNKDVGIDTLLKILNNGFFSKQNNYQQPAIKSVPQNLLNLSEATLNTIKLNFPFRSEHLFENIFNFYHAAINRDLSLWINKEQTAKILMSNPDGNEQIRELNNLVANSFKENTMWKIVEIPMFDSALFSSLKVAVKKENAHQKGKNKKIGTRFVVETEFSNLGNFQFDGYSVARERRLDLVIRTSKPFPDDFCKHIINLFNKCLYDVNYSGTIKINRQENFIALHDSATGEIEGLYV